ncbi:MAG TPA: biopolymer transporter ExbD [Candidatus Manganitrophaceae bacterium]|nr:biopolymer transporter ExbD [Candidatus Manganitrophaceae bacterium]
MVRRMRRKEKKIPYLNLISLMDMFTILVIFLLFQASGDGEVLSIDKEVVLPISSASQLPRPALTITVTAEQVSVDGEKVADSRALLKGADKEVDPVIAPLKERLIGKKPDRVTILGDRSIPFALLKKVMVTATDSGIEQISLAVLNRERE